jgi:hypothetical protein
MLSVLEIYGFLLAVVLFPGHWIESGRSCGDLVIDFGTHVPCLLLRSKSEANVDFNEAF